MFTQPEIGTVGLGEADARLAGPVEVYRTTFRPMLNVMAGREERMLMKLVVSATDRRVLGCHIVGHAAGEMVAARGDRAEDGRDQGRLRPGHAGAPDGGRRTGHDAARRGLTA